MKNFDGIAFIFSQQKNFSADEWQKIMALVQPISLKKGDYFIKQGEINDSIGIIQSGCMRFFYLKNGNEITGEFSQENEFIASYECSILQQPSSMCIEALEDTELLSFSYSALKKMAQEVNGLDKILIALLEKFIVESQVRIASYIMETPEERYLRMRKEIPEIEERVHQKHIASFVGVTPVTLSRIRARLAKKR